MRIERTNDKNYPYTIKGGWGDKVYCTESCLKELRKEINKILKENKEKGLTK